MAEIELPVIVTAIANSEFEGFVAGTLFAQGWSVIYRALDVEGLKGFLQEQSIQLKNIVLIYSPDLPDISPQHVTDWQGKLRNVIGFSSEFKAGENFIGIHPLPKDATELVSVIRGSVRAPLLRTRQNSTSQKKRSHVIAIGGSSTNSGCTTLAMNLAMELSVLNRPTLLLDADVQRPSIAALLGLRKLDEGDSWKTIAPHLSAAELTQERVRNLTEFMNTAQAEFDFVIIDLGSIEEIGDSLTDRRWAASIIHWSCDNAEEIWFLGKVDFLSTYRMDVLVKEFAKVSLRAKVSVVLNMKGPGRKGSDEEGVFLATIAPLKPVRIYTLPRDIKGTSKALKDRATLIEAEERGILRKSIAKIAGEIVH